jgi:hypothetical protein
MKTPSPFAVPIMVAELAMHSWETMLRRAAMMAQGTCTADEYTRMGIEKVAAIEDALAAFIRGGGQAEMIDPFLKRARENAIRLRKIVLF